LKKLLAVGVIVLFLGLACAPSINANISKDSELVEITTEICGLGGGKHTVQLTKEEAEEVDRLFQNIRDKLNTTDSREQAEEIFNEAVVELDKYGLLGGLSIEQTQRMLIGRNSNKDTYSIAKGETNNCIIIGKTTETDFQSLLAVFFFHLGLFPLNLYVWAIINEYTRIYNFLDKIFNYTQFLPFFYLCFIGFLCSSLFSNYNPFAIFYRINLGYVKYEHEVDPEYFYSEGWVRTFSIKGPNYYNGPFKGDLPLTGCGYGMGIIAYEPFPAVTGFTGIKIKVKNSDFVYYLGFAVRVKIEEIN